MKKRRKIRKKALEDFVSKEGGEEPRKKEEKNEKDVRKLIKMNIRLKTKKQTEEERH